MTMLFIAVPMRKRQVCFEYECVYYLAGGEVQVMILSNSRTV